MRLTRVTVGGLSLALAVATLSTLPPQMMPPAAAVVLPEAPAAVVPTRAITPVTAPGPTTVSSNISVDTVWGPLGSPYVLTASIAITGATALTVLPGTEIQMGPGTSLNVGGGQIQMLGTHLDHVKVTGTASSPGSWGGIRVLPGIGQSVVPLNIFDYVDFSYGGKGTDSSCRDNGMLSAGRNARVLVTNSTFRFAQFVGLSDGTNADGFFGVYRNTFSDSYCGIANWGFKADYVDNNFEGGFGGWAFLAVNAEGRFWFNDVHGFAGSVDDGLSVRYNRLRAIGNYGAWSQQLQDWRYNDWGGLPDLDAVCAASDSFESAQPPLRAQFDPICADKFPYPDWYVPQYRVAVKPEASDTRHVPASLIRPYHAQFAGVDTSDGTLTYAIDDMVVEDAGAQIRAGRTYSSSASRTGPSDVGLGWRTSFSEAMTPPGSLPVLTLSDDGEVPLSDPAVSTVYPGVAAVMTTSPQGAEVSTPDHTTYQFDTNGELVGMLLGDARHPLDIDREGGKVSAVTGVSGRSVDFERSSGQLNGFVDGSPRHVTFDYDADGRLVAAMGVDGQTATYEYAGITARLTRVVSAEGVARLAAGYDAEGRVAWVEPQGSGRFTIAYDTNQRTITRPDGVDVVQTLDLEGRLVSEAIVGGSGRHLVYDGDGRMVAEVSGVPTTPMVGYSAPSSATLIDVDDGVNPDEGISPAVKWLEIDPLGRMTTTVLNEHQDPTTVVRPDGATSSYLYDSHQRVSQFTDPRGGAYHLTYGQYGQIESITDPAGRTASWVHQSDGDLASSTSFVGGSTTYTNNVRGMVTETTDPFGGTTHVDFTTWGAVSSITRPRGGVSTATFDADRRVAAVQDAIGSSVTYDYDLLGRVSSMVDPLAKATTFSYDVNGRPEARTDASGNIFTQTYTPEGWTAHVDAPESVTSTTEYDPAGRPVWVTDGLGRVTQTVYDRAGQIVRMDSPDGGHRSWTYDAAGRPLRYTDARGGVTKYEYNPGGDLTKLTNPGGGIETRSYDNLGRPTAVTMPGAATVTFIYSNSGRTVTAVDSVGQRSITHTDTAGRLIAQTDGAGETTEFEYNADGLLASRAAPGEPAVTYGYDLAGQLTSQTDERGNTIQGDYDAVGRLSTRTYPDDSYEEFDYDANGNLIDRRDRAGHSWTYEFDDLNRLVTATDPLGAATGYSYDAVGNMVETVDPTGVTSGVAYDPMDRPAVLTDDAGNATVNTFDLEGNLLTTTDPGARVVTNEYDSLDRVTRRTYSGVIGALGLSWDPAGNLLSASRDGKTFSWTYDGRNRVISSKDALGNQTTYGYDLADRLVEQTTPTGRGTTYDYTPAGRLESTTNGGLTADYSYFPGGLLKRLELPSGAHYDYTYNPDGQPETQTDPEQLRADYQYTNGMLSGLTRPDQTQLSYDYDDAGRLIAETAGDRDRTYAYDDAGRLTTAATSGAGGATTIDMTYDSRGLLASSTDGAGTTSLTHDASGYVSSLTPPSGGALNLTYNAAGQIATVRGSVNLNYTYDKWGRLTARSQQTGTSNASIALTYDNNGRATSVASGTNKQTATYDTDGLLSTLQTNLTSVTNPAEGTQTFTRDTAGRLAGSSLASIAGAPVSETTYGWEDDSNRSTETQTPAGGASSTTTATHDGAGRIESLTDPSGQSIYDYDDKGQLASVDRPGAAQDTVYGYDGFGELVSASVSQPGGGTTQVTYTRDAFGRVAERAQTGGTNPGTTSFGYRAAEAEPTSTNTGAGATSLVRDTDGLLLAAKTATGTVSHTVPNLHGDLMAWRAQTGGAYTQTQIYDPFGNPSTTTATGGPGAELGIGFQTQPVDAVTGLVDMNARVYDPTSGAFTTADTWPGDLTDPVTLNRYTYGNASPVDFSDPTGHFSVPGVSDIVNWIHTAITGITNGIRGAVSGMATQAAAYGHALTQAAFAQAKAFQSRLASDARELAGRAQSFVSDYRTALRPYSGAAHTSLAALGVFFDGADVVDAAWYLLIDHDTKNALIAFASVVPVLGAFVAGGRAIRRADDAAELFSWSARRSNRTIDSDAARLPTTPGPNAAKNVDLYHATTRSNAASIRANGIDLSASRANVDFGPGFYTTRDPAQAADWAARLQKRGFDSEVLHYRVPQSELDSLSGMAFPGPTPAWEDMVRSQRLLGGPAHGMDYVEGPMVGNVFGSWGGGPIDPWGNQVSFHTPGAASMLNRYIQ